mmetsp:Transcript_41027/g.99460  ORF Transcript_41027/g.99460 Transcript_41027/m.99460 type:complete len:443 (-) Transcript_41027:151-1479(-)
MGKEVTRGVAELTLRVTMPCLLFTRVVPAINYDLMSYAWPMLLLPILYVGLGLLLAKLVLWVCQPDEELRATVLVSVAFGNPLSMPLMLLTVLTDDIFDPVMYARLGSIADPIVYLSLFQPLAYMTMYGLGGWLLGISLAKKVPKPMYIVPAASFLDLSRHFQGGGTPPRVHSIASRNSHSFTLRDGVAAVGRGGQKLLPTGSALSDAPEPTSLSRIWPFSLLPAFQSASGDDGCERGPTQLLGRGRFAGIDLQMLETFRSTLRQSMSPPVVAVMLALAVGLCPPAKDALFPPRSAPLGALTKGMVKLGGAAIPVSMLLLGVSICRGPDWKAVDMRTNLVTCLTKMLVLPLIALGSFYLLHGVFRSSWTLLDESTPWHTPLMLAALTVSAMPTGNTMIMLVELGGGEKAPMSTIIFLQYILSPVILTFCLSLFVMAIAAEVI